MQRAARALSLAAATAVALLLFVCPFALGPRLGAHDHAGLAALLLGVSAAFVHGFGYAPQSGAWRLLFSPILAWPLMIAGGSWFVV